MTLLVNFIFNLFYGNDVRQKANLSNFLEFKIGCKAAETTCNISNVFGPGTPREHTLQWWFKKFCKGNKSLEDDECSGQPLEIDNNQMRAIIKADPLTITREDAEELNVNHSTVTWHLKQIGKLKKLNKWVPHELTANKKNCFEVSSSLILHKSNCFSIRLRHSVKSGFYMTTGDN